MELFGISYRAIQLGVELESEISMIITIGVFSVQVLLFNKLYLTKPKKDFPPLKILWRILKLRYLHSLSA